MRDPVRWTEAEMLALAARGLGKVDLWGERGLTLVSKDEIAAMAGVLATLGLVPVVPGAPPSTAPRFLSERTGA